MISYAGYPAGVTIDHNLFFAAYYDASNRYGSDSQQADPLFGAPAGLDFQIQASSPAIDVGSSAGAPASDFDGNPRPQGAGYDLGAYEYPSP